MSAKFSDSSPLSRNNTDGIIERASDFLTLLSFLKTIQPRQYKTAKTAPVIMYAVFAPFILNPRLRNGGIKNIVIKHPNRPICSKISTNLF